MFTMDINVGVISFLVKLTFEKFFDLLSLRRRRYGETDRLSGDFLFDVYINKLETEVCFEGTRARVI